jgi:hypothetical protein
MKKALLSVLILSFTLIPITTYARQSASGCRVVPNAPSSLIEDSVPPDYSVLAWIECDLPANDTCFPVEDQELDVSVEIVGLHSLLDCGLDGGCATYPMASLDPGQVCVYLVEFDSPPDCTLGGCAILQERGRFPLVITTIVGACMFAGLVVVSALLILIMKRRSITIPTE